MIIEGHPPICKCFFTANLVAAAWWRTKRNILRPIHSYPGKLRAKRLSSVGSAGESCFRFQRVGESGQRTGWRTEAVFLNLIKYRSVADIEQARSSFTVPACLLQSLSNRLFLSRFSDILEI